MLNKLILLTIKALTPNMLSIKLQTKIVDLKKFPGLDIYNKISTTIPVKIKIIGK